MTLEEYKGEYHMAPFSLEDFAHGASAIEPHCSLSGAGQAFLDAMDDFVRELTKAGIEVG